MNGKIDIISDEPVQIPQKILRDVFNRSTRIPLTFQLQFQSKSVEQTKIQTALHNKTDGNALVEWNRVQQIRRNPKLFEENLRAENRKKDEISSRISKRSKRTKNSNSKNEPLDKKLSMRVRKPKKPNKTRNMRNGKSFSIE